MFLFLDHLWVLFPDVVMVLASEVAVDVVKHAFITKFNDISADVSPFCKHYFHSLSIRLWYNECFVTTEAGLRLQELWAKLFLIQPASGGEIWSRTLVCTDVRPRLSGLQIQSRRLIGAALIISNMVDI